MCKDGAVQPIRCAIAVSLVRTHNYTLSLTHALRLTFQAFSKYRLLDLTAVEHSSACAPRAVLIDFVLYVLYVAMHPKHHNTANSTNNTSTAQHFICLPHLTCTGSRSSGSTIHTACYTFGPSTSRYTSSTTPSRHLWAWLQSTVGSLPVF